MKTKTIILFAILAILLPASVRAQLLPQYMNNPRHGKDEPFQVAETMPEFPGGMQRMMEYIDSVVSSKPNACGGLGRSIVEFVVETDGSLTHPRIIKSVDEYRDRQALDIVKSMPKWTPGTNRGKKVRVKYVIPVSFRTSSKSK